MNLSVCMLYKMRKLILYMSRNMKKIFYVLSVTVIVAAFSSCRSEDDFTESIFDTSVPVLDETKATYPFDKWLNDNFLLPYNVEIKYHFDFSASDMSFQLTPADYNRSQLLAHFIRYLFYDVYTKYAGEDFMKMYGPRIFNFIGSSGYSPTTGTEVLGTASGGVKITLYNVNEMKPYREGVTYNDDDISVLNERYFHTMHHEFSHILHQTKSYPVTFGQQTSDTYDPSNWNYRDSVWSHQNGYVTHYASFGSYDDFVETLSCIITDTDHRWMNRIINAASMGFYKKQDIETLIDSLGIDIDSPEGHWNKFALYKKSVYNDETGEYEPTDTLVLDEHRTYYQVVNKEQTAYINQFKYDKLRDFTSFKNDFLPWVEDNSNMSQAIGINSLLEKIKIATGWYTEKWGLHAFELRHEVRERQNAINDFLNNITIYELK